MDPDKRAFKGMLTAVAPQAWKEASTFKATKDDAIRQWAKGYKAATQELAKRIQSGDLPHSACLALGFLHFHGVELYLKLVLQQGRKLTGLDLTNWQDHDLVKLAHAVDQIQSSRPYLPDQWSAVRDFLIQWNAAMPEGFFLRYPLNNSGVLFDPWPAPMVDAQSGKTVGKSGGVANYQLGYMLEQAAKAITYLDGYVTWIDEILDGSS